MKKQPLKKITAKVGVWKVETDKLTPAQAKADIRMMKAAPTLFHGLQAINQMEGLPDAAQKVIELSLKTAIGELYLK